MGIMIIIIAVAILGLVGYKFVASKKSTKSKLGKNTSTGKVIVVDNTPVDTSKEDKIKDKFGDLE